jgi:hypothetical protein
MEVGVLNQLFIKNIAVLTLIFGLSEGCKRQPARSVSPEQDIHVSKFLGLTSPDGNLRSYATKADAGKCVENQSHSFAFVAGERKFYRCVAPSLLAVPYISNGGSDCRGFHLLVDVAGTMGAQGQTDVKFFGLSCEGATYLIKEESGLIPDLSSARVDLGEKEIVLRASFISGKSENGHSISQSSSLFLERPPAIRWSKMPVVIEFSPGGRSGEGAFAYLSMNSDGLLCSYRSDNAEIYRLRKCVEGGRIDISQEDGIIGGTGVDLTSEVAVSIDSVKFVIADAAGGHITSAVVAIPFE